MSLLDDNILDTSDICTKEHMCLGGWVKLDVPIYIKNISVINKYFDINMLKKHSRLYGWKEKHDEVDVTEGRHRFDTCKIQKSKIANYINNILLGMIKNDISNESNEYLKNESNEYLKDYFSKFLKPVYTQRPIIYDWSISTISKRINFRIWDSENQNMLISIYYKFLKNDI